MEKKIDLKSCCFDCFFLPLATIKSSVDRLWNNTNFFHRFYTLSLSLAHDSNILLGVNYFQAVTQYAPYGVDAMIAMHIDETGPAPIPISTCECQIIFSIGFVLCHSKSIGLCSIFLCSPAISTLAQEKQQCFSCWMVFKCLHYTNAKSSLHGSTLCSIDAVRRGEKKRKPLT